jgi:hypothetical protein
MFSLKKKESDDQIAERVVHELSALERNDTAAYREGITRIIRSLIKGIIGKTHQYTFEESLFILNEEGYIAHQDYERLKSSLLKLAFLKYSPMKPADTMQHLDGIRDTLIDLAPRMTKKCTNADCLRIYTDDVEKDLVDKTEQQHMKSKQYKNEILETERKITEAFENRPKPSRPLKETANAKETPPDTISLPFSQIFDIATGYPLEKQTKLDFSKDEKQRRIWDLYIKYYILEEKKPDEIFSTLRQYGVSEQEALALMEENKSYPSSIKRFRYVSALMEIIIQVCLHILLNNSVDETIRDLTDKGYEERQVMFVLSNILMGHQS